MLMVIMMMIIIVVVVGEIKITMKRIIGEITRMGMGHIGGGGGEEVYDYLLHNCHSLGHSQ